MAKAKALTRKITRKQARSYEQSRPNARGVTHIAELNGDGAYERRYSETKEFLSNTERSMAGYTPKQRSAMKKMSPARRASFKKMLDRAPSIGEVRRARRNKSKRRATPNKTTRVRKGKRSTPASAKRTRAKALARARSTPAARKQATRRLPKAQFIKQQLSKGRSPKQAAAAWKLAHGRHMGAGKKTGRQTRKYAGKYKALRARVGPTSRWTYKYRAKKGVRDIPDHALLGYPSAAALRRAEKKGSEAERRSIARKSAKLHARRERGAQRQYRQSMEGRGLFVPNAGDEILSFEEWKEMRPNATAKQRAAARRNIKKAQAALRKKRAKKRGGRKTSAKRRVTKKRTTKKRTTKKRTGWTKAKRVAAGKKAARTRKRRSKSGTVKRRATSKKRRTTKKRKSSRRGKRVSAATRRKISLALKRYHRTCATGGRKRKTTKRKRGKRKATWTTARRNQGSYAANRRRYRSNVGGSEYMVELKNALKLGVLVTVGYVAHRAVTKLLSEQVLGKIDMFATGNMAKYRSILSSVVTALIGIPVTVRVAPKQAVPVAAGMAASLIHGAIIEALSQAGQADAAAYLSNYPNAEGSAYGSYYTFQPHEVYSGVGSYYELPAMQGFGQSPLVTQAAAGYGQLHDNQLMQAAAGYGQLHDNQLMQAAAGYGQNQSPLVSQAAAGTGEYIAYGVSGIGEYDEVEPAFSRPMNVDEGIFPNLHSAEQALSVAEAASGIGNNSVPLQSTVNPMVIADPINDLPGGSRSGVFQGGDGIFG